jgi:hypothetical protein
MKIKKLLPGSSLGKTIFIVTAIVFLIFIIFSALFFLRIKSIYSDISFGRKNLDYALTYISEGNFNKAKQSANQATKYFDSVEDDLSKLQNNFLIKNISFLNDNLSDFNYLAKIAKTLSDSADRSLGLVNETNNLLSGQTVNNFSELSIDDKMKILKKLYESSPEMQGIKANIDLSLFYLKKIENNKLLSPYSDSIKNLEGKLIGVSDSLSKIISLASIIPVLTGYPEPVSYLVILQNSNELRPTGGFIGTYGIIEVKSGEITKLQTNDVYHLDMPASLNPDFKVEPPEAIKKYIGTDSWYMRDSNWSPDWTVSAKKIEWFYQQEMIAAGRSSEIIDFSGVIAINPRVITDLLYFVGPIEINGQVYNKDNFIEILQYEVEMAFKNKNISEWDRKSIINDILEEMKNRLYKLSADKWLELGNILNQNISRKNIFVYLKDDYNRQTSSSLNWDGEIENASLDYLMVVDANLAALKTDRVMAKSIKYYLDQEADNKFKVRVEIIYKNNGWIDWQTTRYRTFTRVYVPYNSAFVNVSGLTETVSSLIYDNEISYPKTYWSGFIVVEPKEEKKVVFEYYLPTDISEEIIKNKKYSLYLQKQSGNTADKFEAELNFYSSVKSFNGEGSVEVKNKKVLWSNSLDKDYNLEIMF